MSFAVLLQVSLELYFDLSASWADLTLINNEKSQGPATLRRYVWVSEYNLIERIE